MPNILDSGDLCEKSLEDLLIELRKQLSKAENLYIYPTKVIIEPEYYDYLEAKALQYGMDIDTYAHWLSAQALKAT